MENLHHTNKYIFKKPYFKISETQNISPFFIKFGDFTKLIKVMILIIKRIKRIIAIRKYIINLLIFHLKL